MGQTSRLKKNSTKKSLDQSYDYGYTITLIKRKKNRIKILENEIILYKLKYPSPQDILCPVLLKLAK